LCGIAGFWKFKEFTQEEKTKLLEIIFFSKDLTQILLSKLSKKQLVYISEKLIDEDFPSGNPYGTYTFDEEYYKLENIGKYFGVSVVHEDVEFFSKFLLKL
jgi:hypothetical protein